MDNRLKHEEKIFSKSNWLRIKEICNNNQNSMVSPILTLDLTRNCNYACRHCVDQSIVNKGEQKEIDWEILSKLLIELRTQGCDCIELTGGGEPTLYTNFSDLLKLCTNLNYKLALISNGVNLYKYKEDILNASFDWIRISLDAATEETYSIVHKCPNKNFLSLINTIKEIANHKNIGISYLILNENYHEISAATKLAKEIGAQYIEIKPLLDFKTRNVHNYESSIKKEIKCQLNKSRIYEDDRFSIIYPESTVSLDKIQNKNYNICQACYLRTLLTPSGIYPCTYFRGITLGTEIPHNKDELLYYRNVEIQKINPENECTHFCARHGINMFLKDLIQINKVNPQLFELLGWPADYGKDVLWL